jgi:hypothetical protein
MSKKIIFTWQIDKTCLVLPMKEIYKDTDPRSLFSTCFEIGDVGLIDW